MSGNQLLAVMAASDAARLKPNFEDVALEQHQILFQADAPITHVYFPYEGVVSLQVLGADGAVVEAATIGNEGMVGLGGLLADDVSFTRQLVQLPGRASRIARDAFLAAIGKSASLRGLLANHADAFAAQALQTSACNAQHSTEERMARWLLMAFDRCGTDRINLTHDDLAVAFGVRRPTVTLVVRSLQAAQILETTRRAIAVIDRPGLEQISCECYQAIRKNYERVFAQHALLTRPLGYLLKPLAHADLDAALDRHPRTAVPGPQPSQASQVPTPSAMGGVGQRLSMSEDAVVQMPGKVPSESFE